MVGFTIIIDTARRGLRLPPDKLACLRCSVASWLGGKSGHCLELEALHGRLSHMAVVAKPDRIFLRQLSALMAMASRRHYLVDLDLVARADLAWWERFY